MFYTFNVEIHGYEARLKETLVAVQVHACVSWQIKRSPYKSKQLINPYQSDNYTLRAMM